MTGRTCSPTRSPRSSKGSPRLFKRVSLSFRDFSLRRPVSVFLATEFMAQSVVPVGASIESVLVVDDSINDGATEFVTPNTRRPDTTARFGCKPCWHTGQRRGGGEHPMTGLRHNRPFR